MPSVVSGSDPAAPLLGNVADGSMRDDASPLSLPGPLTDSDSEPCDQNPDVNIGGRLKNTVEDE